jgi:hypothetical protein
MIAEQSHHPKTLSLNFGEGRSGINNLLHGKGFLFSCTFSLMALLLILMFTFVVPLGTELNYLAMRFIIIVIFIAITFLYARSVVEIVAEEDNVQFRIFRKFHLFLVDKISSISICNFSTWGIISIYIKADYSSRLYFLWAPSFERERYNSFLAFLEYLRNSPKLIRKIQANMAAQKQ